MTRSLAVEKALQRFPEILRLSAGNIGEACKKCKISRGTYNKLYNEDKEFRAACDDVQEGLLDFVESKALQLIEEGNTQMIIFYLKTKGRSRGYIERTEVDTRSIAETRIVVRE